MINRFRREVYQSMSQRGDAWFELMDSLSGMSQVESPVTVSESPLFRRQYSSIYDVLKHGEVNLAQVRRALYQNQPTDAETMAGYQVYAVDCTDEPHTAAETLADRTQSKKGRHAPKVIGHRYSWLCRVVSQRPSWCMPQDVERVKSSRTDSEVAAEQVKRLDEQGDQPKVVTADALYGNGVFLEAVLQATTVDALVRVRRNGTLYAEPPERQPHQRGRPRKHGAPLHLKAPHQAPERSTEMCYLGQRVRLQAWHGLHFRKVPLLVGLLVRVEFLKPDGTPRYQRPLYLFWTGAETVPLPALCCIYLWRFAIEHLFRFLKQHLGLTTSRSPDPNQHERWVWSCALAAAQLVLIRHQVAQQRPPWQRPPTCTGERPSTLTARQTQRNALAFLRTLETPATLTRTAGKACGRPLGFRPKPRTRYAVIKKANRQTKSG